MLIHFLFVNSFSYGIIGRQAGIITNPPRRVKYFRNEEDSSRSVYAPDSSHSSSLSHYDMDFNGGY